MIRFLSIPFYLFYEQVKFGIQAVKRLDSKLDLVATQWRLDRKMLARARRVL